jgi:nucleic acid binding protein
LSLFRKLKHLLTTSRDDLEAADEQEVAGAHAQTKIAEVKERQPAKIAGVVRSVTYSPAKARPIFVACLYDGTASIDLAWMGRREVAGIWPGIHLVASGTVVAGRTRPTIFTPAYEIVDEA